MTQIKNRFARWFAIYFPEYTDVFGDYEAQSSMLLLKKVCTPEAIVELGAEKINQIWRDARLRAVGMKRATTLCETAKRSIGLKKGSSAARYEMKLLLEDYEYKKAQLDAVMEAAACEYLKAASANRRSLHLPGWHKRLLSAYS
jgi:transposase